MLLGVSLPAQEDTFKPWPVAFRMRSSNMQAVAFFVYSPALSGRAGRAERAGKITAVVQPSLTGNYCEESRLWSLSFHVAKFQSCGTKHYCVCRASMECCQIRLSR